MLIWGFERRRIISLIVQHWQKVVSFDIISTVMHSLSYPATRFIKHPSRWGYLWGVVRWVVETIKIRISGLLDVLLIIYVYTIPTSTTNSTLIVVSSIDLRVIWLIKVIRMNTWRCCSSTWSTLTRAKNSFGESTTDSESKCLIKTVYGTCITWVRAL